MSPDSAETRIRHLEEAVATLKAQLSALESKHADHETDIRQYAPSLIEMARFGERLNSTAAEIRVLSASVTDLRAEWRRDVDHFNVEVEAVRKQQTEDKLDLEKHRAIREEKEREKERVDRRYRLTTLIAAGGLFLTTMGLAIAIITLLNQAPK